MCYPIYHNGRTHYYLHSLEEEIGTGCIQRGPDAKEEVLSGVHGWLTAQVACRAANFPQSRSSSSWRGKDVLVTSMNPEMQSRAPKLIRGSADSEIKPHETYLHAGMLSCAVLLED